MDEGGENQIIRFAKIWAIAYTSLIYTYAIGKLTRKGMTRLIGIFPVIWLFLTLPLGLTSVHLVGTTAFFLAWLANFKLLLFGFGSAAGPLQSSLTLPRFLALASLPINIQTTNKPTKHHRSHLNHALKAITLAALVQARHYTARLNNNVILVVYSLHIYLSLEIILAAAAALARAGLGVDIEPQFDEPYLATSLQDFWGRRWNLAVTRVLRPSVYDPVLSAAERLAGREWARIPAVVATFTVSALMHELIFFYIGRSRPTWEVTWFFVLHGLGLAAEMGIKRSLTGRVAMPRVVSAAMTVAFVMATASWLFFPPLLRVRADVRAFEEYAAVGAFLRGVIGGGAAALDFGLGNVNSSRSVVV